MIRTACILLSFFLIGNAEPQENPKTDAPGPGQEIVPAVYLSLANASSANASPANASPANASSANPEASEVLLNEVTVEPLIDPGAIVTEVQAGRQLQLHIPGATAALSIDPGLLEASAADGVVTLTGRAPGRAAALIITPEGMKQIFLLVDPAPPSYPPGFVSPLAAEEDESGTYEFRFASDRTQIQNRLDFTSRKPGHTTQIRFVNVNFLDGFANGGIANGGLVNDGLAKQGRTTMPSGFYRISTPGWNLTLMDESVTNSPLTIDGAIVRGVHFEFGTWAFHAGYSSLATFSDFLIPTQREAAFGVSHTLKLAANSELVQNLYYFPTTPQAFTAGNSGGVGSLAYKYHPSRSLQLLAEIGFSHGVGVAADLQWSDTRDDLHASLRRKPADFASLSIGNLPGTISEFSWTRKILPTVAGTTNFAESNLILPTGRQKNLTTSGNLQYKIRPRWTVSTGATYADFSQTSANGRSSIDSFSLPEQLNFDSSHFGAGFQYQSTRTSGSLSLGQDLRGTGRFSHGGLQITGFVERQTQVLTLESLYSQIPSLRIELERLGLTAIDPAQLMALLQDNAFLQALGFSQQASLNLVPIRLQVGASLNWSSQGKRPQRLSLDFVRSRDMLLQGSVSNWAQSGNYTKSLSRSNELFLSYSWFRYSALKSAQYSPLFEVGLKHSFSSLPAFLDFGRHGTVTGVVYVDDEMRAAYDSRMRTLPGVEIVLDGAQQTQTDSRGRYIFTRVPAGTHTIEAKFKSALPFWFTSPSVVSLPINSSADFGIAFALSELVGHLRNDAGLGIEGVQIEMTGSEVNLKAHSDADGRFAILNVSPGDYELKVDATTFPAGYVLEELKPLAVHIDKGVPQNADFQVRAMRTLSGSVSYYDPVAGQYVPVADALVEIPQLSRRVTTDHSGKFVLQDLPAGHYQLMISAGQFALTREVAIPAEPVDMKQTFRMVETNK